MIQFTNCKIYYFILQNLFTSVNSLTHILFTFPKQINHLENLTEEMRNFYRTQQIELSSVANEDQLEIFEEILSAHSDAFFRSIMKARFDNRNTEHRIITRIINSAKAEFSRQFNEIYHRVDEKRRNFKKGLTSERIRQFDHFEADESLADERCSVCMGNFEIGKMLIRLDCDGRHLFCQVCIEGWFADHNTCPICRHLFCRHSF